MYNCDHWLRSKHSQKSVNSFNLDRKRKRSEELKQNHEPEIKEAAHTSFQAQKRFTWKRQRISPAKCVVEDATCTDLRSDIKNNDVNLIHCWIKEESWSEEDFKQDSSMIHSLTWKRSTLSLSKHESNISDISLRERKNSVVKSWHYEQLLTSADIYMHDDDKMITTKECKTLCQTLLNANQTVSHDSLFNDDLFKRVCQRVCNKNEVRIICDLSSLLVLFIEILYLRKATNLEHLIETVDESWIKFIFLVKNSRSQFNLAVKFKSFAFIFDQLKKLQLSVDDWQTTSHLMIINEMYFSFLTAKVKCNNEALNIANWQNAHSVAVAANVVIEL